MTAKEWLPICLTHGAEQPPLMRTVTLLVEGQVTAIGYQYLRRDGARYWKLGNMHVPDGEFRIDGYRDDWANKTLAWGGTI